MIARLRLPSGGTFQSGGREPGRRRNRPPRRLRIRDPRLGRRGFRSARPSRERFPAARARLTSPGAASHRVIARRRRRRARAALAASSDVRPATERAGVDRRGRQSRFRFGACQARALAGAASAFDVGAARRAVRAITRRNTPEARFP